MITALIILAALCVVIFATEAQRVINAVDRSAGELHARLKELEEKLKC